MFRQLIKLIFIIFLQKHMAVPSATFTLAILSIFGHLAGSILAAPSAQIHALTLPEKVPDDFKGAFLYRF